MPRVTLTDLQTLRSHLVHALGDLDDLMSDMSTQNRKAVNIMFNFDPDGDLGHLDGFISNVNESLNHYDRSSAKLFRDYRKAKETAQ